MNPYWPLDIVADVYKCDQVAFSWNKVFILEYLQDFDFSQDNFPGAIL